uniref:DUF2705 family protein n=1 Tax=Agathobacter sp. TaxID=2021311 RepID=UPI004056CB99
MRELLKIVSYDIRSSFRKNRLKWMIAMIILLFLCVRSFNTVSFAGTYDLLSELWPVMSGAREYTLSEDSSFTLPAYWFLFHGYLFFLIGFYPANELYLGNGQPLIRTASRTKWIISKQINLFVSIVAYYGCFLIFMLIGNYIHGAEIIPENGIIGYCGIPFFDKSNLELFTAFIFLPMLMSVALGQIQILMSLFISPVISLMLTVGYMVASVFWMNPLFIGNYSMLLRQDWISCNPDISVPVGVVICIILIFATSFAGIYMFQRKDILPSE